MITFNCRMAGWNTRFNIILPIKDKEYSLKNVQYQVDNGKDQTGTIILNMLTAGGNFKKECYLIFDTPLEMKIYPGGPDATKKIFTKVKIPKDSIRMLLSFLSDKQLCEKSFEPILKEKNTYTLLLKKYVEGKNSEIIIKKENPEFKHLAEIAEDLDKAVNINWTKATHNCTKLLEWGFCILNIFDQGAIIVVKTDLINKFL